MDFNLQHHQNKYGCSLTDFVFLNILKKRAELLKMMTFFYKELTLGTHTKSFGTQWSSNLVAKPNICI